MKKVRSNKEQEELNNVAQIASSGTTKEVESLTKNIKGDVVGAERSIILPSGEKLSVKYVGKKLTVNKMLHIGGKTHKALIGTLWDDIPVLVRLKLNFKDSDFK